jgi:hypothetical protein
MSFDPVTRGKPLTENKTANPKPQEDLGTSVEREGSWPLGGPPLSDRRQQHVAAISSEYVANSGNRRDCRRDGRDFREAARSLPVQSQR